MERIDVLTSRSGPAPNTPRRPPRPRTIAIPPVCRDARIVTANDVVRAKFIFFGCAAELTVNAGISPIGLESPDPDLIWKQIQGVHCP